MLTQNKSQTCISYTKKQRLYFNEVIRLHYEEGLGEERNARILPIGHTTASRWIAIFAKEKGMIPDGKDMEKPQVTLSAHQGRKDEVEALRKRVKELEAHLLRAEIKWSLSHPEPMRAGWRKQAGLLPV